MLFSLGLNLSASAQSQDKKVYVQVEQMPQFADGDQGLLKFLGQNIQYPKDAKEKSIEGVSVLSFVVNEDGSLSDIQIVRSLSSSIDSEAMRVIKLTNGKWKSGKMHGKDVPVKLTLPIRFAL
jgi:TonB family protein